MHFVFTDIENNDFRSPGGFNCFDFETRSVPKSSLGLNIFDFEVWSVPELTSGSNFDKILEFSSRLKTQRKTNEMLEVFFVSLGALGASLESPCGPWNDPGASSERPLSDPGQEMLIES